MSFLKIFTQVNILFVIIIIGYIVRKFRLLDASTTSKMSSLIMDVFLPAMIVTVMQLDFDKSMFPKIIALITVALIMFAVSMIIAYFVRFFERDKKRLAIFEYALIFSNVGFMGYPVIEAILGKDAIFYAAICNLPFYILFNTLGAYIFSRGNSSGNFSFKDIMNNSVIAVIIGLILFSTGTKLPVFINKPLELLGNVTTPLSMLAIGSMLAGSSAIECFKKPEVYIISFLRLIVIPFSLFAVLKLLHFDPFITAIPVIISAMPSAANTAILASEYNSDVGLASQIVFFTTLMCSFSIPVISVALFA